MTAIPTTSPAVGAYLASVRAALSDLPAEERDELCEDLEQHLVEVAAEFDEPLAARLGSPESYAAELRASAGLGAPVAPDRGGLGRAYQRARQLDHRALAAVRTFPADLRGEGGGWVVGALRDMRPAWWAVRGYLVVVAIGMIMREVAAVGSFPIPYVGGSILGLVLGLVAAAAALELGRRGRTSPVHRRASAALSVVALLGVITAAGSVRSVGNELAYWRSGEFGPIQQHGLWTGHPGVLVTPDGWEITNIFPYGPDGEPLDQVLLYDQGGNPIELEVEYSADGFPLVTSYPLSADGRPLLHVFPQRQAERGDVEGEPVRPAGTRPDVDVPQLERPARDDDGRAGGGEGADAATDRTTGQEQADEPAPRNVEPTAQEDAGAGADAEAGAGVADAAPTPSDDAADTEAEQPPGS